MQRPSRRAVSGALVALVGAFVLSCHDSPTGPTRREPSSAVAVQGATQTGTAGAAATDSLVVRVTDDRGNPVAGVVVSFAVASGGGSLSASSDTTDANGRAAVRWTLGTTAGAQQVIATIAGLAPVAFTATVEAAEPAVVQLVGGNGQTGAMGVPLADSLVLLVKDAYGNVVKNVAVHWAAGSGGTVSPSSGATNAAGRAATSWTLGPVFGPQMVTVTVGEMGDVAFGATAGVPPGATLVVTAGDGGGQVVYGFRTVTVQARTANGQALAGVPITWTVDAPAPATGMPAASLSPTASATDAQGNASTQLRLASRVGANTVTASAPGGAAAHAVASGYADALCSATAGAPFDTAVVGTPIAHPIVAMASDQFGNPVAGWTPAFMTTVGTIQGSLTTDSTGRSPGATWTLGTTAGQQELRYTGFLCQGLTIGALTGRGQTYTVLAWALPGPAAAVSAAGGDGASAQVGSSVQLTARVADQYGNPASGAAVAWAVRSGGGSITPATSTSEATGLAATTLTLGGTAGPNTATASIAGASATFTVTGTPGAANALVKVSGDDQAAAVATTLADSLVVRVTDGAGNGVSGTWVTFAVSSGGGSVSASSVVTDAFGRAGVRWTLGTSVAGAGPQQVSASVAGLTPVTFSATARPGPVTQLVRAIGEGQTGTAGQPLPMPIVVEAMDAYFNDVADVGITWTVTGGSGAVSPTTGITGPNGRTSTSWTISAGSNTLVAATSGGVTVTFHAIGDPASGWTMAKITGDGAVDTVYRFQPIGVQLRDAYGTPMPGVTVSWSVSGPTPTGGLPGASISSITSTTDAQGRASTMLRLSTKAGTNTVTATAQNVAPTTFTVTGVADRFCSAQLSGAGTAPAGELVPGGVSARSTDQFGNGSGGYTPSYFDTAGGTLVVPTTGADGTSSGTWRLGPTVGTQTVTYFGFMCSGMSWDAPFQARQQTYTLTATATQPPASTAR